VQLHLNTGISIGSADASDDTVEVNRGPKNEPYMIPPPPRRRLPYDMLKHALKTQHWRPMKCEFALLYYVGTTGTTCCNIFCCGRWGEIDSHWCHHLFQPTIAQTTVEFLHLVAATKQFTWSVCINAVFRNCVWVGNKILNNKVVVLKYTTCNLQFQHIYSTLLYVFQ
jgi:hypothetical protein